MIHLRKADYYEMIRHARACLPEEACGLLAGHSKGENAWVEKVYLSKVIFIQQIPLNIRSC